MAGVRPSTFTEGSTATSGPERIRPDLAREAMRLARVIARLVPYESEALGRLAPSPVVDRNRAVAISMGPAAALSVVGVLRRKLAAPY